MSTSSMLRISCLTTAKKFNLYIVIQDSEMSKAASLVIAEQLSKMFENSQNVLNVEVNEMNVFNISKYSDVIKTIGTVAENINKISST